MLLSALSFSVMNMIIRYVSHLPVFELVFFRSIGTATLTLVIIKKARIPILGTDKKRLLLRALFGVSSMAFFYKAIQLMPVGTAVSLRYLSPIFASAFAIYILKEKVKPIQWLFFLIAFCGVSLIKGFDARITIVGFASIMSAAVLSALVYTTIRRIGNSEHPLVIINYFMVTATIVGAVGCLFQWTTPQGIEWLLLISLGILGYAAQLWMTKSLQAAETNLITPVKYSEAVFTLIAGWLIFGEGQNWYALAGIFMVIGALVANVWVKRRKTQG